MAVFIAAADESADQNPRRNFLYGGFAAPVCDWEGCFAEAWNERVLCGPPALNYLHMTEMMSPAWRKEQGITEWQVDQRLDEAANVIASSGSLVAIIWSAGEEDFNRTVRPFAPRKVHTGLEQPDYLAFLAFAFSTLQYLSAWEPSVERVDFWLERNDRVTTRIERFHSLLAPDLSTLGRSDLADLVGELLPVGKDRIPAQAADFLCWHERRFFGGTLGRLGARRRKHMLKWRRGHRNDLGDVLFDELHDRLEAQGFPRPRAI
jgi:hypothetical protein